MTIEIGHFGINKKRRIISLPVNRREVKYCLLELTKEELLHLLMKLERIVILNCIKE